MLRFPKFPTTEILDTGVRANESPAVGWTAANGTFRVTNNKLEVSVGGVSAAWNAQAFPADCEVFVTVSTLDVINNGYVGMASQSVSAHFTNAYQLSVPVAANALNLSRFAGGASTALGSFPVTFVAGDGMGMRRVGNVIEVWHKTGGVWVLVGRAAAGDNFPLSGYLTLASGGAGFRYNDFGGGIVRPPRKRWSASDRLSRFQ